MGYRIILETGVNQVLVKKNGPLLLKGEIEVFDAQGKLLERSDDVALCRCGESANKPFCDGSHKAADFTASGMVEDDKSVDLEGEGGLSVTVRSNAMVVAKGPMLITGSEGGETTRNKAALCRCGHSDNKPFCDASHKTCGFEAG